MTRTLTRTNFNSSQLLRVLADLGQVEAAAPGSPFAEKLATWVDFTDAIRLCAAHSTSPTGAQTSGPTGARQAVGELFARVRTDLVRAISNSHPVSGAKKRAALPAPKAGMSVEDATVYEPYRKHHLMLQRDMELAVKPLRAKIREVLARASASLNQLADLDAAFEGILSEREAKLLAILPSLMQKRFEQQLKAHQLAYVGDPNTDNPELWMKPGGWLARFCHELESVLLAELDIRLQPTLGLLEALNIDRETISYE